MFTTVQQDAPGQPPRAVGISQQELPDLVGRRHAPRPPEAELAASRGLIVALLLVLPFWLVVVVAVSVM